MSMQSTAKPSAAMRLGADTERDLIVAWLLMIARDPGKRWRGISKQSAWRLAKELQSDSHREWSGYEYR